MAFGTEAIECSRRQKKTHSEPLKLVSCEASNLSVFSLSNSKIGDSGTIRTYDPLLRRSAAYPSGLIPIVISRVCQFEVWMFGRT